MTQPIQEPSVERELNAVKWRTGQLARRPTVASGFAGEWQTPTLVNGYLQPTDPYEECQFRLGPDELHLEFKGHLNVGEAISDTVAFTLPSGWRLSDLGHEDQFFATTILTEAADPASTSPEDLSVLLDCIVYIEADSGDVFLIWDEAAAGGGSTECCDEISDALAAHIADTADAHDASAISILDAGGDFTATDVEAALAELFALIDTGGGGGGGSGLYESVALIADQKSSATDGGTFTSGAWQERDLQTEVYDPDGIVSISGNEFTLGAGTYEILSVAPGFDVDRHQTRLFNVTDSAVEEYGSNAFASGADTTQTDSIVSTTVTITSSKAFRIEHQCQTTRNSIGFGVGNSFGGTQVYTQVIIRKLSATSVGYALLRDEKSDTTDGGDFNSGDWRTRTINTEVVDAAGIVTISSNQFTLQAGTYRLRARAPGYSVDRHQLRLRNITDSTTTSLGASVFTSAADDVQTLATLEIEFTITSAKAYELQHRCQSSQSVFGFGVAGDFGVGEIFAEVAIEKVA